MFKIFEPRCFDTIMMTVVALPAFDNGGMLPTGAWVRKKCTASSTCLQQILSLPLLFAVKKMNLKQHDIFPQFWVQNMITCSCLQACWPFLCLQDLSSTMWQEAGTLMVSFRITYKELHQKGLTHCLKIHRWVSTWNPEQKIIWVIQ